MGKLNIILNEGSTTTHVEETTPGDFYITISVKFRRFLNPKIKIIRLEHGSIPLMTRKG